MDAAPKQRRVIEIRDRELLAWNDDRKKDFFPALWKVRDFVRDVRIHAKARENVVPQSYVYGRLIARISDDDRVSEDAERSATADECAR